MAGEPAATYALSYWVELEDRRGGPPRRVGPGYPFRSGDRIRLNFESNHDGYVRLVQETPQGNLKQLFPVPEEGLVDPRLRARVPRPLPSEGHWFKFDDQPGTERIVVAFAVEDQAMAPEMLASRHDLHELTRNAKTREGAKGLLVEADEKRNSAEQGTYIASLDGGPIVWTIELRHE